MHISQEKVLPALKVTGSHLHIIRECSESKKKLMGD